MKQILQNMSTGETSLITSPDPAVKSGHLTIGSTISLISSGTERMLVEFGQANLIQKAKQQPEKVAMVLDKVQTDGLLTTVDAVRSKLAQPLPLGYCNVGQITTVGSQVEGFKVGDRVISNGPHAEVVRVAKNLCALIPENVSDEEAAFTVAASIGLQGIRLAQPTLGEAFIVTGVGLIGLLTVQLLRAHGCRVLAIDYDDSKLELAKQFGAEVCHLSQGEDPIVAGMAFSRGNGIDGAIITASTKSTDPITQAALMCRKRGRIILVGVTGLELNRADFYEKELSFQVSCSYGPGRYDADYEENGQDYPIGFVRWTEQRNFEAILDMMSSGRLNLKPLITHRFKFDNAPSAYDTLTSDKTALGILLQYSTTPTGPVSSVQLNDPVRVSPEQASVGFIGAGNYASRMLIPAFKKAGAQLHTICTSSGISGVIHGKPAGFIETTTDTQSVFNNDDINTVAIVTRHNSHARFVTDALAAGKHVFVEKPLALSTDELSEIEQAYTLVNNSSTPLKLMVGFNRRFSPQIQKIMSLLRPIKEPKSLIMTMNAGAISADHWTQHSDIGGGRIIGEACHFIDLMRFIIGHPIDSIQAVRLGDSDTIAISEDKATITLTFTDGSFGTIHYFANGSASFPKERVEIFTAGRVLQLDNFRKLKGYGWHGFKRMNLWRQDKGQNNCAAAFITAIEDGAESPIPASELFEVAKAAIDIAELLRKQS